MKKQRLRPDAKPLAPPSPRWIALGVLFGLTLVAYWNSFDVPLVFDDLATIQRNSGVRFGEFDWNPLSGRTVLYLLFTANYIWAGQDVWSYHLINLVLHLLNGILIFFIAERIFQRVGLAELRGRTYAALASALFLVHPIQTESVTYISSRSELLSTFFYLIALFLFIIWPERKIGFFLSCVVAVPFLLGIGSKETAVTLPATLLLYDFVFLSGGRLRTVFSRWRFYTTFIVGGAGVIYYFLTGPLRQSIGAGASGNLSSSIYFLTQVRVIVRYIRLLFLPAGLNLDYDFRPSTGLEPAVIASFLLLGGILVLGWFLRQRAPIFTFSIFWFFITLSPTSSFVPILDVIFEHRLYLPLAGVCLIFPLLIEMVYTRMRPHLALPGSPVVCSALLLMALTAGSISRNQVWRDEVRLFKDVVEKSPHKERPYNALSWAYFKRGDYANTITTLQKALEMVPDKYIDFSETLANVYLKAGKYDEAVGLFQETIRRFEGERVAIAYNNLGNAYMYKWSALQSQASQMSPDAFAAANEAVLAPAAEAFQRGLEIQPDMPATLDAFINVSYNRGKGAEIEAEAFGELKQNEDFNSLYVVGKSAFLAGDWVRADAYFERAEKLKSDVKILYFNHGYALAAMGQDDRAIEKYLQAVRIDPIFYETHNNLGLIYMRKNEYAKAAASFEQVLQFEPKHFNANFNLAKISRLQGKAAVARSYLQSALESSPGNPDAITMMKELGL